MIKSVSMNNKNVVQSFRFFLPKKDEQVIDLANKVFNFLTGLKAIDPTLFSRWYEQAHSEKKAKEKAVLLNAKYLESIIHAEWDNKFPHLGCTFNLWSGKDDDTENCQVSFNIGKTTDNVNIKNVITLSFPFKKDLHLKDETKISAIKTLIKNVWNPSLIEVE